MTKQEILAKVNELIAAPSVCANVKEAAEAYAKSQNKDTASALVKALEAEVCTVDELIGLCESEDGKKFFGAEKAGEWLRPRRSQKLRGISIAFVRRVRLAE
ncbi:MAG: hypothetical protein IJP89_05515 [Synergistaceae bacterium]|nr:hypothetical protein [Synergistaceae bacterium]MBR0150802.1 hypothetical protein [Synergistaceae bacterium]